jgi:hypothetical protein
MNTDGHGCQAFTESQQFTRLRGRSPQFGLHHRHYGAAKARRVNKMRLPKSVFIRVHPWLMTASSDSNCGIEDQHWHKADMARADLLVSHPGGAAAPPCQHQCGNVILIRHG